jgi:hypothetical protein
VRDDSVNDGSWLRQPLRERPERPPEIVVVGEAGTVQSAAGLVAVTRPKDFSFCACDRREHGWRKKIGLLSTQLYHETKQPHFQV